MPKSIHRPEYLILTRLLRDARGLSGMHQADVAEALGRSQSFLSDVENGARRLDLLELSDLCRIFEIGLVDFVKRFEDETRTVAAARKRNVRGPHSVPAKKLRPKGLQRK